jgi:hypothetical protein
MVGKSFDRASHAMSSAASKARLIWILLAFTLLQAWGSVLHVHEPVAGFAGTAAFAQAVQAIDVSESTPEDKAAEGQCHCLWCAPRLHAVLAFAVLLAMPLVITQYRHPFAQAIGFRPKQGRRGAVPPPRGPPA